MNDNVDKRKKPRRQSKDPAWADPGGILPVIDCQIVDISDSGAKLKVEDAEAMPSVFQLQVDSTRVFGNVEVVWRRGSEVGVVFLDKN